MADPESLGGEYILHEEIGRGALAVVRRATSRLGGPPLAAKLLRPEFAGDRRVRDLFIREEAALRDLDHPSIVGVRDLVVERGRLALLMDYVDGPNLRRHLADRGGRLSVGEAATIAAQVAAALGAAHAQGVVHLDLKPENILLVRGSDPPVIRISDFGIATLLLDADREAAGGTPGYMAPEVRRGGPATAAADVYAIGVLLVELIEGSLPHDPDTPLPEPYRALARDCLAEDPRSRPSARAVAARLRSAGSVPPPPAVVHAEPDGDRRDTRLRPGVTPAVAVAEAPPPPSPERWRRGPLLTLAGLAVAAALLVGVNAVADSRDRLDSKAAFLGIASATATAQPAPETPGQPANLPPTVGVVAADRTRATFVGHVDNDAGTLAISMRDGVAIAYICDGNKVEAWLHGTVADGKLALKGKNGAAIAGTLGADRARGQVTVIGRTNSFTLAPAKKPSGLYRTAAKVKNARVVGSWIVLPDGRQVGVLTDGDQVGPAPRLDVTGRTATVDGTVVSASTIDVDTGEGF